MIYLGLFFIETYLLQNQFKKNLIATFFFENKKIAKNLKDIKFSQESCEKKRSYELRNSFENTGPGPVYKGGQGDR